MPEKITQEQAVEIIKWLGFKNIHEQMGMVVYLHPALNKNHSLSNYAAPDFLYSHEGQGAVRKKLLADGKGIYEETGMACISWADDTVQGGDLLIATLKMLKEEI